MSIMPTVKLTGIGDSLQEGTAESQSELRRLEKEVNDSDRAGLRARWESGKFMLALRNGKQLPKGLRVFLMDELKLNRSEITARMKLAEKYPTEEQLADVIGKFGTWYAITHQALTDSKPDGASHGTKANPRDRGIVERLALAIAELDPTEYSERDVKVLENAVSRFKASVTELRKAA